MLETPLAHAAHDLLGQLVPQLLVDRTAHTDASFLYCLQYAILYLSTTRGNCAKPCATPILLARQLSCGSPLTPCSLPALRGGGRGRGDAKRCYTRNLRITS